MLCLVSTKVTNNCYDLGIKGQGQIYLEHVARLVTQTPLVFLTKVLPFLYNECQYDIQASILTRSSISFFAAFNIVIALY